MKSEILLPLVFTLTLAGAEGEVHKRRCETGHFFDTTVRLCQPCSTCPPDQIVRRPCGGRNDVLCGDFTEFSEFNQHPEADASAARNATVRDTGKQQSTPNSVASERGWRKLSMALVIVLSLGLALAACGLLTFYLWRRRQAVSKEITTVVYQRDPLSNDAAPHPAPPTFPQESPSPLQTTTFVPQPCTSGERKRGQKKNEYVKLFRPAEKGSGEIDLDLEEKMAAGFVSADTKDMITETDHGNRPIAGTSSTPY